MINDLLTDLPVLQYVDDCTVFKIVSRSSSNTSLQINSDIISNWTDRNNMRLNVSKTKELRLSFLKDKEPLLFTSLNTSRSVIEVVNHFKPLGVTISANREIGISDRFMKRFMPQCVGKWNAIKN